MALVLTRYPAQAILIGDDIAKVVVTEASTPLELPLSFRVHESVKIGRDVSVTLLALKRQQARFAFAAPESVKILREELLGTAYMERKAAQG